MSTSRIIFFSTLLIVFSFKIPSAKLLSYQSEYEISLANSEKIRLPGKTYVNEASGQLFIDWINNCQNSWVSNQRMMTRFINSHGVGTVSEINYSLNEKTDGSDMDFVLEVKEDAELVERVYGEARIKDSLIVKFPQTDKENLNFSNDVIFPHHFLEEIISNLYSDKQMITKKVYEGTIPNLKLPKEINNKFKKIRMSYYQDNEQTPVFEQTINLNDQGVANFFRYDYPDYSLVLKLKKITLVNLDCN